MLMSPLPRFAVTMGPVSWTYLVELVCTKRFDALRFEGLTPPFMCERAVSLATVSPQVPPIFVVHHRFPLRQASDWAFNTALAFAVPPGLNTIALYLWIF